MRADRLARLHAAIDRQAGEMIRVVPYRAGSYLAGGLNPTRAAAEVVASVTEVPKVSRPAGAGATTGHNAELRRASHTVTFTTAALPWRLADGDRVVLLERGGVELKVAVVDLFGTGRTVARLEPLKAAP